MSNSSTSKQVKALGHKTVRVSSTATKHPWITAQAWHPAFRYSGADLTGANLYGADLTVATPENIVSVRKAKTQP